MIILVLYTINYRDVRNTIAEHTFCFRKYLKNDLVLYLNIDDRIPFYAKYFSYDAVLLHYTFLSQRFLNDKKRWQRLINELKKFKGFKVAMPQDDYDGTDQLCYLFNQCHIKTLFTVFDKKEDYTKAYKKAKTLKEIITVLTGYVDDMAVKRLSTMIKPFKERKIDIGYRARKLPYYFGKHGQLKHKIATLFLSRLKNSTVNYDITSTNKGSDKDNVFYDKDWYKFLLKCKAFLGCESGSSILDNTGIFKKKVLVYMEAHPKASFSEVQKKCFPNSDGEINCFVISPRHFEACMTKTLQILVEGNYNNILVPEKHYIPLKKDFSNYQSVVKLLKNQKYCEKIIDNAYKDIIISKKYHYSNFAKLVRNNIYKNLKTKKDSLIDMILFQLLSFIYNIRNTWTYYNFRKFIYYCYLFIRGRLKLSFNIHSNIHK
jgi:hypothetical protein